MQLGQSDDLARTAADDVDYFAGQIAGLLLLVASVVGLRGHTYCSLWLFFACGCCGIVATIARMREKNWLPAPIQRHPWRFCTFAVVALAVMTVLAHTRWQSEDAQHAAEVAKEKKQNDETHRWVAEQRRRRRLTTDQKEAIKKAIAPFAGQNVSVWYPMNDAEASQYAGDFAAVFQEAGWDCEPIKGWFYPTNFENVVAAASTEDRSEAGITPPKSLFPLVKVLMDLGLSDNRGVDPAKGANFYNDLKKGELALVVATKLPPSELTSDASPSRKEQAD